MLRHLAPAGAPIRFVDLIRGGVTTASIRDTGEVLRQHIKDKFAVRHVVLTVTGRAGMTLLLRALQRLAPAERNEVVLPSYTCYSLAASAIKAGLRPRIVDISPRTLDFAPESLERTDFSRVLAIVASNLYGLPNDLPSLSTLARDRGVFLIDDAAQSMGAQVGGRWSGTWGDAGLFSFDKGKPVSAIDGGVVVTNSDAVADALNDEGKGLESPQLAESARNVVKAVAYATLLRPWLYWIPQRIPQLGLGKTVYSTEFPMETPSRFLAALGSTALDHLDEYTQARTRNAVALLQSLKGLARVATITPNARATPTYLRLPILVDSPRTQQAAIGALQEGGIGASGSYPASLADIPELRGVLRHQGREAESGRHVAGRIVTLPTHPYVSSPDISRMVEVLTRVVASPALQDVAMPGGDGKPRPVCAE
ncbi:MAG: DegT/DnrJ/EryC1/StrS family aminotransferase [Acidobacteria bacterium]|nr:DegT/DnrJ/EryC1/StrS family aminotransferase [Acidobacteriota bacterium]